MSTERNNPRPTLCVSRTTPCSDSQRSARRGLLAAIGVALVAAWLVTAQVALAAPPRALAELQSSLTTLIDRVGPRVVTIEVLRRANADDDRRSATSPSHRLQSGGGVIIGEAGLILTAEHVVANAEAIHVTLADGRRLRASIQGADPRSDLAVLRVSATGLVPAELGNAARVRRGHLVLVFGNPLGLSRDGQAAVSFGMVSAIGRSLPESFGRQFDRDYGDLIQTSAPVNPGDSGGPLIDVDGRVIGIITAISSRSGVSEGLGFAVPVDARTRAIIETLREGRTVAYGYLGAKLDPVDADTARRANLPRPAGALVQSVEPDGPADVAGLRRGDVITTFAGHTVESNDQLVRLIGTQPPGSTAAIRFVRNGQPRESTATLARRDTPHPTERAGPDDARDWRGALLVQAPAAMRARVNAPAGALLVLGINSDSPADRAGLDPGDLIIRIGSTALDHATKAQTALDEAHGDVVVGLAGGATRLVRTN